MRRATSLLLLASLLAGCGLMQVEDRAIPSLPGAVAATEWQAQELELPPDLAEISGTTPEAYLQALAVAIRRQAPGGGEVREGMLSQSGGTALAYLQVLPPDAPGGSVVANEARLTLARASDGTWGLAAIETRYQCAAPLTAGSCGDTSGGAGEPQPVTPPAPPAP